MKCLCARTIVVAPRQFRPIVDSHQQLRRGLVKQAFSALPAEVVHAGMKNLGLGCLISLHVQKNPRCSRRIQLTSPMKYAGTILLT
jgi:hypothetical protein